MNAPSADTKGRLLTLGVVAGFALIIAPFIITMTAIRQASNVDGGLRGATHLDEKQEEVGLALGSASFSALLIPPGILLLVFSGVALKKHRNPRPSHRGDEAT